MLPLRQQYHFNHYVIGAIQNTNCYVTCGVAHNHTHSSSVSMWGMIILIHDKQHKIFEFRHCLQTQPNTLHITPSQLTQWSYDSGCILHKTVWKCVYCIILCILLHVHFLPVVISELFPQLVRDISDTLKYALVVRFLTAIWLAWTLSSRWTTPLLLDIEIAWLSTE